MLSAKKPFIAYSKCTIGDRMLKIKMNGSFPNLDLPGLEPSQSLLIPVSLQLIPI